MNARRGMGRGLLGTALCSALAAVLVGCGVDDRTLLSGGAAPNAEAPSEDEADGAQQVDGEGVLTGASCLRGRWQLRNDTFETALAELVRNEPSAPAEIRAGLDLALSGASYITFDEGGKYTASQDDFTMRFRVAGDEVRHVQSSADTATYGADDQFVWVSNFTQEFVDAKMHVADLAAVTIAGGDDNLTSVTFFGTQVVVPGMDRELIDGAAAYTCSRDSLTLHADGGMSAEFSRVS
ncbi:MAG TPA: hypothetical protein VNZ66_02015 [Aeromicrobium sp.]|nr:hypothetical protein [Aeromicrobium sp.]